MTIHTFDPRGSSRNPSFLMRSADGSDFRYPIQISWYFSKMVQENQIKFKKAPLGVDKMINEIIMKM
jgi:hypothetical protein